MTDQLESSRVLIDPQSGDAVCFSSGGSFDLVNTRMSMHVSEKFGVKVVDSRKLVTNFAKNVESLGRTLVQLGASVDTSLTECRLLEEGFWFTLKDALYWLSPKAEYLFHQNLGLGKVDLTGRTVLPKRHRQVPFSRATVAGQFHFKGL